MNWKEIYAIIESKTDGKVYRAGGSVEFDELPEPGEDHLGYVYNVTDAFETTADFVEGAGISYPAGTNVIIVDVGTESEPVYKYDVLSGLYEVDDQMSDVSENPVQNKVVKAAIEEAAEGEEITTTATGSALTLSTSSGNVNALTVFGKSEVVDGSIKSAGEGWSAVDLGTLTWTKGNATNGYFYSAISGIKQVLQADVLPNWICSKYNVTTSRSNQYWERATENKVIGTRQTTEYVCIVDNDYATVDATAFKNAMSGVLLCYELADPTQGNTIAVKTDNGSGIDGTMATFTTGTPLYGVSDSIRDVMQWDGSAGTVTKVCGKIKLKNVITSYSSQYQFFYSYAITGLKANSQLFTPNYNYIGVKYDADMNNAPNMSIAISGNQIKIKNTDYTTVSDFLTAIGDTELVYELATPTTQNLTSTENNSIAGLRTYNPTTHVQNNAQTDMTVEAYAGTANGKAVQELKQNVQSEISALKITQSATLTLTVADWSDNAQTVSFAHDTAKRNVIDVDPASVEEWASCGVLATAETASGITFTCKTVPTNALNFRVTSMGV